MNVRRVAAAALTLAAALALAGCHAPVVTMVEPPGWGAESAMTTPTPTGPLLDEVLGAAVPSICGMPSGILDGGSISGAAATPIANAPSEPMAQAAHIAIDPGSGEPIVALAADDSGAVGAAAVFACEVEGVVVVDRVVVWDAQLQPLGVINLAALRGTGPVVGTSATIGDDGVRVAFQEIGEGTPDAPTGDRMSVPLTIVAGQIVVGNLSVES